MKRKAIFGGTFDPLHNGHLNIAYEALYKFKLDKVIFIPSGNPPHKVNNDITNENMRFDLVYSAIKDEKNFEISDYEIKKNSLSYTYETIEYFNKLEPLTQWYFITGVDCLMEIHTWKNVKNIINSCRFVVFNRPGYNYEDVCKHKLSVEKKYEGEISFLDIPLMEISSTKIRKMVKENKNISYLVPEKVYKFIKKYNIYR